MRLVSVLLLWASALLASPVVWSSSSSCSATCPGGSCSICSGNCNQEKKGALDLTGFVQNSGYVLVADYEHRKQLTAEARAHAAEVLGQRDVYVQVYPVLISVFERMEKAIKQGDDAMLLGAQAELRDFLRGPDETMSLLLGGSKVAGYETNAPGRAVLCGCRPDGSPKCERI